jgi:hypothetical protein
MRAGWRRDIAGSLRTRSRSCPGLPARPTKISSFDPPLRPSAPRCTTGSRLTVASRE